MKIILGQLFTEEECEELVQASNFVEVDPDSQQARVKALHLKQARRVMPVGEALPTNEVNVASPRSQDDIVKVEGPSCTLRKKQSVALGAPPTVSVNFADGYSETSTAQHPKDISKSTARMLGIADDHKAARHSMGVESMRPNHSLPPLVKRRVRKRLRNNTELQQTIDPAQLDSR